MYSKFFYSLTFILATGGLLMVQQVSARCNACMPNGIACISEKSYQLCFDSQPDISQTYDCLDDLVCSDLKILCAPAPATVCTSSQTCGKCDGTSMFTCTSRTTFRQCNGTELMPIGGTCPAGKTCDTSQKEFCVDDCRLGDVLQCSNEVPIV